MATTPKGIYYPNNYNEIADIPEDMKKMAESIDEVFENTDSDLSDIKEEQTTQNNRLNSLEVDNTTNKSDILTNKQEINNIKTEQTEQNTNISTNATNIESLQEENENLKKIVSQLPQVEGQGTSITLENTIEAQFTKFDEEGNSVQDGTPSPDNEVPILSAGDNGSINEKIQTRNWFDVSKISQLIKNRTTTTDGITNIDNVITINKTNGQHGSYAMNYLMPIKSGQITVSFKALLSGTHSNTGILVALYNSTATIYATTAQTKYASSKDKWLDYNATFELNQEAIDGIHLDIQAANTGNVIQIKDVQVELGSTATPFVEHKEQDYSIFVQQPMRSIGDVRDGFVQKDGSWYERHYIGEVVLNGSENWGLAERSETSNGVFYIENFLNTYGIIREQCLSNYGTYVTGYSNKVGQFDIHYSQLRFYAYNNTATINDWKNKLTEKNLVINGFLAEPLDLPCTETQIQQLENKPSTYKDFTIIQSEDETEAYLEVSGIYDLNKLITRVEVIESEV